MNRMKKLSLAVAITVLMGGISLQPVHAAAVTAGTLTCNAASGWGIVFGSSRDIKCTYSPISGFVEHYVGHIDRFGVDAGYIAGGIIIWSVLAPTTKLDRGALAGDYGGLVAGATPGVGGTVNLLVGGSAKTVSLQPLSVEGSAGVNVAAGVTAMTLHAEE